jgi:enamine deaminase RidA (YjgF/YER057c/UK114 family)
MSRKIGSGAKWEDIVGYSRAVQVGNTIEIAGTTAVLDGEVLFVNDPYKQTEFILELFSNKLKELGSSLEDVVRTRICVTHMHHWEEVGKAHGKFFKGIKPACTLVGVAALVDPKMLVEIEATAIIG